MNGVVSFLPPGESPIDPASKDIDPIAFALERSMAYLHWIEEHKASFEATRRTDSENAERELVFLSQSAQEAKKYLTRLAELLLAGYSIDPSKKLPPDFARTFRSCTNR